MTVADHDVTRATPAAATATHATAPVAERAARAVNDWLATEENYACDEASEEELDAARRAVEDFDDEAVPALVAEIELRDPASGWPEWELESRLRAFRALLDLGTDVSLSAACDVLGRDDEMSFGGDAAVAADGADAPGLADHAVLAYRSAPTLMGRHRLANLVASRGNELTTWDDGIETLSAHFRESPEVGAVLLRILGDIRAIPLLESALDAVEVGEGPEPTSQERAAIEMAYAIDRLDGTLSPERRQKVAEIEARQRRYQADLMHFALGGRRKGVPHRAPQRPGPNEPCPCGSGRKFKRCCG